jgi:SAM-dependent methyltransferase
VGKFSVVKTFSSRVKKGGFHTVACNLCGADFAAPFLTDNDFLFVRCRRCGLVYQNPQPVSAEVAGRYDGGYFDYEYANEDNFFNLMLLGLKDAGLSDSVLRKWPDKTFLDIGCATGKLPAHMQARGWSVRGVEICRESAEYGIKRRGVPIFIGTLEQAGLAAESVSLIHFSHLIEQVPDPRALLTEVRRILKPDGYALITTPNCDGLQARLFKNRWRSAIADHLFLFSKKTLARLLLSLGFRIHKIVTWGGLAKGSVPLLVKKPADYLAKKLGFGDVVLFKVSK